MKFRFAGLLLAAFVGFSALISPAHSARCLRTGTPNLNQTAGQQTLITEKHWQRHPKIREIRRLVRSIDTRLKQRAYKISERRFDSCPDQYFTLWRIARDAKGVAAWYRDYSEGEDATFDFSYYYDHAGRLRFVFAVARGANDTREHLRIYFDETGKRLWKDDRLLKGPGCPGCFSAYAESDEGLAFDPKKAFVNDRGCTEIKPNRRSR